jgi:hypothetical protein
VLADAKMQRCKDAKMNNQKELGSVCRLECAVGTLGRRGNPLCVWCGMTGLELFNCSLNKREYLEFEVSRFPVFCVEEERCCTSSATGVPAPL